MNINATEEHPKRINRWSYFFNFCFGRFEDDLIELQNRAIYKMVNEHWELAVKCFRGSISSEEAIDRMRLSHESESDIAYFESLLDQVQQDEFAKDLGL